MRTRIVMVAAAALAGCGEAAPDPRGVRRGETLLVTTGTGRSGARPDQATFTAGLSTVAPTAEAATARNAEAMNRIVASLRSLGVEERDAQTRDLSVSRIDYGPNRGRFEARNVVAVRMRRVDQVGRAVAAATGAGANILSGPDLTVADPERASLAAHGAAYRAARAKADAYAAAAGLTVSRILAIHDGGQGGASYNLSDAMAEERAVAPVAAPPPPVLPGTNRSMVSVRVEFALVRP